MKWHWKRARWLFCFLLSLACCSCFILFERILFLCRPFAQTSDRTNGRFVDTITWAASTHSPSQSFMSFIRHHAEHHTVSIWFAIIPKWAVVALPFSSGAFHCFSFFFFSHNFRWPHFLSVQKRTLNVANVHGTMSTAARQIYLTVLSVCAFIWFKHPTFSSTVIRCRFFLSVLLFHSFCCALHFLFFCFVFVLQCHEMNDSLHVLCVYAERWTCQKCSWTTIVNASSEIQ